eukprot:6182416-Prorocentrum_lima.AAC.1
MIGGVGERSAARAATVQASWPQTPLWHSVPLLVAAACVLSCFRKRDNHRLCIRRWATQKH